VTGDPRLDQNCLDLLTIVQGIQSVTPDPL
jgi:hypothetical protein